MLNLASLCFPDNNKSCFYCCPPIRNPEADPLDNIEGRCRELRLNRKKLPENIALAEEISGEICWGLGFLDDAEQQAGCLLHPLRHGGDDLRHLTGYQFKCANALCREAMIFAELNQNEQQFCLSLCQEMDSFTYSSRSNPLMRLLAWETEMVKLIISDSNKDSSTFSARYGFLWQQLDFRLDGYLALEIAERGGVNFLRNNLANLTLYRDKLIVELKEIKSDLPPNALLDTPLIPTHKLAIPLSLSRLLKFGADLWELPAPSSKLILSRTEQTLEKILLS
ncbi:hypothetical protein KAI46_10680 [bacterium]|nr:hypothetical protein [bacterium]